MQCSMKPTGKGRDATRTCRVIVQCSIGLRDHRWSTRISESLQTLSATAMTPAKLGHFEEVQAMYVANWDRLGKELDEIQIKTAPRWRA